MKNNSDKKVVLVTGATSGIGKSVAHHLSTKNYRVFGTYRSEKSKTDENFTYVQMDVRDENTIRKAVAEILETEGRIDVLINNAGVGTVGSIEDTTVSEAKEIFETNVFGVHAVCREIIPIMRKQKSGIVINISSIAGKVALPYRGIYNATKFAIEGFSEALSLEVKPFGIKVVIVEPGDYKTNINSNRKISKQASSKQSAYYESFNRAHTLIKEEINTAWTPDKIAYDIDRILSKNNPKLHYVSAPLIQKISVHFHHYLPSRFFERILSRFYNV